MLMSLEKKKKDHLFTNPVSNEVIELWLPFIMTHCFYPREVIKVAKMPPYFVTDCHLVVSKNTMGNLELLRVLEKEKQEKELFLLRLRAETW